MSAVRTPIPPRLHERRHRIRPGRPRRRPTRLRAPRRPRRWSRRRVLTAVAAFVVLAGLLTWLVLFSSLLAVRSVEVSGLRSGTAGAVRQIAAIPEGVPLARVDVQAVTERLRAMPAIESVSVERSWPSTIRIAVVERAAVALVDRSGAQWLIDRFGVLFAQVTEPPAGVPELDVDNPAPEDPATRAAVEVIPAVPADIRGRLARVSADSPESVVLHLAGGRTVIWGGAEDSAAKAQVLEAVFDQPGSIFDVSSPSAVVVR